MLPSGKLMTVQPLRNAIVMACSSIIDFPLPLSPTTILRMVFFSLPSRLISSNIFPYSIVSRLISIAGFRNKFQPWVVLKACAARSWSAIELGRARTRPSSCVSAIVLAAMSCIPCTSSALVLLSTIRLRRALRSPMAGFLTRSGVLCFFFLMKLAGVPFFKAPGPILLFGLCGRTWRGTVEVKDAVWVEAKTALRNRILERHLQQA